jgi:hypothetical protein
MLSSLATTVLKIILKRAKEIFISLKEGLNCISLQKVVPGSHTETCQAGDQVVNIKVEGDRLRGTVDFLS